MKYFSNIFTLSTLVVILCNACVFNPNPIPVEIEEVPQKIVISSFAFPPQELALTVTRTFSALLGEDSVNIDDTEIADKVLVDSALVIIRYAGRTDTLINLFPALFGSINVEQIPNEKYSLYVKDYKTGESVTAETTLLPFVRMDTIYSVSEIVPFLDDTLYSIKYKFTDLVGTENYYLVTYSNLKDVSGGFASLGQNVFKFNDAKFNVFTDQNYGDGNPIEFRPNLALSSPGDTLVVGLSNITKGYYNFLSAYKRSGNLLSQIVAEPITLPTNIEGGYGYFAMIKPSLRLVIIR